MIYLIHTTTTLFWLSSANCWKKDIIFLASLMMKISQSKRQLKCCFNEYIKLTIYQASLYLIEILSSSSFFESLFVNDWAFLFDCSSSITLKLMIKANKLIRMLSDIFVSSVHTCRMTDSSDYSWLSLLTITSCLQSFFDSLLHEQELSFLYKLWLWHHWVWKHSRTSADCLSQRYIQSHE